MSITHNIINKRPLDFSKLNNFVSTIDGAKIREQGQGTFYYWIDGKSTRGVDITLETDCIEIRNTALSNRFDYELTNKIVTEILALTDGIIFNEEDIEIQNLPIFDNDTIIEKEIRDCEVVRILSKEHEITIYGPVREVYFGKRLYEKLSDLEGEYLRNLMINLILTVNYQLPDFDSPNIMLVSNRENDDEQKKMIVLSNESDYIFGRYDNILLHTDGDPIMITNEILNTMLPQCWMLVDEYTVIAPIIDQNEWEKLLANAKRFDLIEPMPSENVLEKLKQRYDSIGFGPHCGRIAVKKNGLTGFVNIEGTEVIPTIYRSAMSFIEGMSVVSLAVHKYGLIDINGKEIIPCKYDNVRPYQNGYARVEKGIYWAVIDKNLDFIIPFNKEYQRIEGFFNGLARVKKGTKWGVINLNGDIVAPIKYYEIDAFKRGLARIRLKPKLYGYMNEKGEEIVPPVYEFIGEYTKEVAVVLINGKQGLVNRSGNIIFIPENDFIGVFNSVGHAVFVKGEKMGIVNNYGEIIIPAIYENHEELKEAYTAALSTILHL